MGLSELRRICYIRLSSGVYCVWRYRSLHGKKVSSLVTNAQFHLVIQRLMLSFVQNL